MRKELFHQSYVASLVRAAMITKIHTNSQARKIPNIPPKSLSIQWIGIRENVLLTPLYTRVPSICIPKMIEINPMMPAISSLLRLKSSTDRLMPLSKKFDGSQEAYISPSENPNSMASQIPKARLVKGMISRVNPRAIPTHIEMENMRRMRMSINENIISKATLQCCEGIRGVSDSRKMDVRLIRTKGVKDHFKLSLNKQERREVS